jgi:SNF2 family DNA or RNA helicase
VWEESKDKEYWALLLEMGCGKTKVTIDTMAYLALKGEINAVLVISPNGVHRQWITGEIPIHMPDTVPYQAVVWQSSRNTKAYRKQLETLMEPSREIKILSMNVESFSTKKGTEFANKFLDRWPKNMVVVDESSKIKTVKAKRTKNVVKLRRKAKYRRILTGTPVTQSPLDVYPQMFYLCPTILGFTSFVAFKSQYAIIIKNNATDGNGRAYTYENIVGYKRLEELADKVSLHSSRILKEDCLDLPEKIYQQIPVQMTKEQKRLYEKLKEDLLLECDGEDVPVPLVLTQLLRLQQLTGGHLGQEDGTAVPVDGGNPKLKAMLEDIETLDTSEKVIIWARFRPEIETIVKELQKEYGQEAAGGYYGDVNQADRAALIDRFTNGDTRFFVANAQCAGLGLNLTAASIVYYFSNTFSLEERLQSEDRAHRIGQKKSVVYKDLACIGTVDEKVHKALAKKKSVADIVTQDGVGALL